MSKQKYITAMDCGCRYISIFSEQIQEYVLIKTLPCKQCNPGLVKLQGELMINGPVKPKFQHLFCPLSEEDEFLELM